MENDIVVIRVYDDADDDEIDELNEQIQMRHIIDEVDDDEVDMVQILRDEIDTNE